MAVATPFSDRIRSPIRAAFSIITLSDVALTRAEATSSGRKDGTFNPTPSFETRMDQKNWSLRKCQFVIVNDFFQLLTQTRA